MPRFSQPHSRIPYQFPFFFSIAYITFQQTIIHQQVEYDFQLETSHISAFLQILISQTPIEKKPSKILISEFLYLEIEPRIINSLEWNF